MLLTTVQRIATVIPGINPRVVEFGCHYLSGKQTIMTLTKEEIALTKEQILKSINDSEIELGVAHTIHAMENGAEDGEEDGDYEWNWFSHPTLGVVGGFNYSLEEENGKTVAKCIDTWDFNPGSKCDLVIPNLPTAFLGLVKMVIKLLGLKDLVQITDYGNGFFEVSVIEDNLSSLNDKHAFQTLWTVEFEEGELTCKLPTKRSSRRNKFK